MPIVHFFYRKIPTLLNGRKLECVGCRVQQGKFRRRSTVLSGGRGCIASRMEWPRGYIVEISILSRGNTTIAGDHSENLSQPTRGNNLRHILDVLLTAAGGILLPA